MILTKPVSATIFIDADNTLWDADSIFAQAQRNMLERVEAATGSTVEVEDRLAHVRTVDQAIAERHHARLRYPPKLLVRGLEASLRGLSPDQAARAAWGQGVPNVLSDDLVQGITEAFKNDLSHTPEVRPGVQEGLEKLKSAKCLVLIVSEGTRARVERTAKRLGLDLLVARIIASPKQPELYRRVLRLAGTPERAFMIGDQLDRDIIPAKAAGLETIYFPGGFRPRWTPDEDRVHPDHRIQSFAEVPSIVLGDQCGSDQKAEHSVREATRADGS